MRTLASNKKYKNQKRIFETVNKERKNFFDRAFFKASLISKSVKICTMIISNHGGNLQTFHYIWKGLRKIAGKEHVARQISSEFNNGCETRTDFGSKDPALNLSFKLQLLSVRTAIQIRIFLASLVRKYIYLSIVRDFFLPWTRIYENVEKF